MVDGGSRGFRGHRPGRDERRRREALERATQHIAEAALTAPTLQELYAAIHRTIAELMPARNFYIALPDAESDLITVPYFVDEYDQTPEPKTPGRGLTEYVLRTGQPLLGTAEAFETLVRRGEVPNRSAPFPWDWLGVPLGWPTAAPSACWSLRPIREASASATYRR